MTTPEIITESLYLGPVPRLEALAGRSPAGVTMRGVTYGGVKTVVIRAIKAQECWGGVVCAKAERF